MAATTEDPRPVFDYALRHCPQKLQITVVDDILLGGNPQDATTRGNEDKGKPPTLTVVLTADQVKNLRGSRDRDILLLVRIPHEVVRRSKSGIILPGEI